MDGVDGWPKWVVHLWQSVVLFLEGILKNILCQSSGTCNLVGQGTRFDVDCTITK